MTTNPIIAKIQKLLNTSADSGATAAEAASALAIANRLMLAHRVTPEQIAAHARGERLAAGNVAVEDMVTEDLGPRTGRQDGWLAMAVGAACSVGVYQGHRTVRTGPTAWDYRSEKVIVGYGLPADLAVAKALYEAVREESRKARKVWCRQQGVRTTSVEGRSFADGYSLELMERAQAERDARAKSTETVEVRAVPENSSAPEDTPVLALVVVGEQEQAVERALVAKRKQLGLGKGRARRVNVNWEARSAGAAAARGVSLSRNGVR